MPDPAENPTLPPALAVWPPPPSSAPETFTVEGVTVTRHGEQLSLVRHYTLKSYFVDALLSVVGPAWLMQHNLHRWSSNHYHAPPYELWPITAYRQEVVLESIIFVLLTLCLFVINWHRVNVEGKTVVDRSIGTLTTGERSELIAAVAIKRQTLLIRHYHVHPLLHSDSSEADKAGDAFPVSQTTFTFRRKKSAEQVAHTIAEFLNVPFFST